GTSTQEAPGPLAPGSPDHASGDGDSLPPASRCQVSRPDLSLVDRCAPSHGFRGTPGLLLHGHGDQRAAGTSPRRGVFTSVPCRGRRLEPVEPDFEQSVLASEFHSVKGAKRREDWVRDFRGRWFPHRETLEAFRNAQETSL